MWGFKWLEFFCLLCFLLYFWKHFHITTYFLYYYQYIVIYLTLYNMQSSYVIYITGILDAITTVLYWSWTLDLSVAHSKMKNIILAAKQHLNQCKHRRVGKGEDSRDKENKAFQLWNVLEPNLVFYKIQGVYQKNQWF